MEFHFNFNTTDCTSSELNIIGAYTKKDNDNFKLVNSAWSKECKEAFSALNASSTFSGKEGEDFLFTLPNGSTVMALGLGEKSKVTLEKVRRVVAKTFKRFAPHHTDVAFTLDHFVVKSKSEASLDAIVESIVMSSYSFDKYLTKKSDLKTKNITFDTKEKKTAKRKLEAALAGAVTKAEAVNRARDFVNEPPNVLNSEVYAKEVEKDVKGIPGVKVKVLNKAQIKKEKMGLFLSVNSGSGFEPRLVHLTYTPKKVNSKTKHIALVGKGLTFDTGGYSLKPSASMINMKFDMAGSATVYGAFKAAAELGANVKISCFLGMTDNAVNSFATMPDAVVKGRNGKTVEILNTDAEGRLVMADVLDYACDFEPDAIIDAATLTGACLVAVGHEVCAVMGNNQKLVDGLLKSANSMDERMWQLPIIEEYHNDLKSPIADLKNIAGSRWGGTGKAAAFLSNFVKNDIAWAHLDIAGIGDGQGHIPYCPAKGASGLIVRSLVHFMSNYK
jgi:leucyl aminopeptidase